MPRTTAIPFPYTPQDAARLRKHFQRAMGGLNIGNRVMLPDGSVGEFQGISANRDPTKLVVNCYTTEEGACARDLGTEFEHGGQCVPIEYNVQERPEIVSPQNFAAHRRLRLEFEGLSPPAYR